MKRFVALLLALILVGCSSAPARFRGQLVENGQPLKVPATTLAIEVIALKEDGSLDREKLYPAVVNEDGSFEVIAGGGTLPLGKYAVAIQATGTYQTQLKRFAPGTSPIRREIKPGSNEITIDVAKPEG